jgi:hypothetical protein
MSGHSSPQRADQTPPHDGPAATVLQVTAISGYGLWMWLGLALGLGMYPAGRGDALVPLAWGGALVSAPPLMACLRLPAVPEWLGWRFGRGSRPTREGLLALATYLPMMAVGGLVRGDNLFWATRLAGAALALCSLASLVYAARRYGRRCVPAEPRLWGPLPLSRVAAAGYTGGLWLWLCLLGQNGAAGPGLAATPWAVAVLALALLLGLVEGVRWRALRPAAAPPGKAWRGRFLAAVLIYAVPCLAVLLGPLTPLRVLLAAVTAVSSVAGRSVEQYLYGVALAARAHASSA